ncbi:MAG: hypothetical protein ACK5HS_02885, partial [Mycoplasmatales bacterium]
MIDIIKKIYDKPLKLLFISFVIFFVSSMSSHFTYIWILSLLMFPSFIGIVLSIFFMVIDVSLLNTSDLLISLKHKKYKDIICFLLLLYLVLVFIFILMPLPIFLLTELSIVPLFFSYAIQTINSLRRTNLKYA